MRNRYHDARLNSKRKQRINCLAQKFGLLSMMEEIVKVWGWKARRRTVNSLARRATV